VKLGKTSWLILILGVFIIAFGSLGITRAQQVEEQNELEDTLSVAEKRLANLQLRDLQTEKLNLEQQLAQAELQLEQSREALRHPITSIDVTDALFKVAGDCEVKITEISSSGVGTEALENINCSVIKLNIGVEGEVLKLIDFVTQLNTDFPTGLVKSADISTQALEADTVAEGLASDNETLIEEEEESAEEGNPTARIQMIIYSYQD
jgi:hypothetical protein